MDIFDLPERQAKVDQLLKNVESEEEIYCICRTSDISRFMIACDSCDSWFHGDCVGVSEEESERIKRYYCPPCMNKNPVLVIKYKKKKKKNLSVKKEKSSKSKPEKHHRKHSKKKNKRTHDSSLFSRPVPADYPLSQMSDFETKLLTPKRKISEIDYNDKTPVMKKTKQEQSYSSPQSSDSQKKQLTSEDPKNVIQEVKSEPSNENDYLSTHKAVETKENLFEDSPVFSSSSSRKIDEHKSIYHDEKQFKSKRRKKDRHKRKKHTKSSSPTHESDEKKSQKEDLSNAKTTLQSSINSGDSSLLRVDVKNENKISDRNTISPKKSSLRQHSEIKKELHIDVHRYDDPFSAPEQCLGPECVKISRPHSKYCSDDCGLRLAEKRILRLLPERVKSWNATPSIANQIAEVSLKRLASEQTHAKQFLKELDEQENNLNDLIARSRNALSLLHSASPSNPSDSTGEEDVTDNDDELSNQGGSSNNLSNINNNSPFLGILPFPNSNSRSATSSPALGVDISGASLYSCVTCGAYVHPKNALKHMEKCFIKYEQQTWFGSVYKTKIDGSSMFCDYYNPEQKTYCKRLRVICPEHSKDPNKSTVKEKEVCGYPLVEDVFEETGKFCRLLKHRCTRHPHNWDRLRRAEIDLQRVRTWMKIEELFDTERQIRASMASRGGLIGMLLYSTVDHMPESKLIPDILKTSDDQTNNSFYSSSPTERTSDYEIDDE